MSKPDKAPDLVFKIDPKGDLRKQSEQIAAAAHKYRVKALAEKAKKEKKA